MKKTKYLLAFATATLAGFTALSSAADEPLIKDQGIGVRMSEHGAKIDVDGVPFNKHAEFYVIDETWKKQFFAYPQCDMVKTSKAESNTKLVTPLKGNSGEFTGTQVWEILPGRKLKITVDACLNTTVPAQMQTVIASVYPEWYNGAKYIIVKDNGTTVTGTIPTVPPLGEFEELTMVKGFKFMEIDGALGTVTMRPGGDLTQRFVDYRKNRYGDANQQFNCGPILEKLDTPTTFTFSMEFEFGKIATIEKREVTSDLAATDKKQGLKKAVYEDRIIPTPKDVKWGKGTMALTDKTTVSFKSEHKDVKAEEIAPFADNLIRTVDRRTGVKLTVADEGNIQLILKPADAKAKPDQYSVKINDKTAVLESPTTSGLLCAVQTFRQLVHPTDKNVRCATVNDYASMPLRGIHFFTGHGEKARDLQVNFMRNVLGEFKLNTLIYEASYINWKCLPQEPKLFKYSMEPELVRDVIKTAKEEGVEIIPMVNSFGHCEWLLDNDKRTHLADNSATNYTYDATNPEVYTIVEKVYEECNELFKPRAIHIGHDEISFGTSYPQKEEAKKIGEHKLFIKDTMHWYNFLRNKLGVETWMWSDMLYHHSEVPDAGNAPSLDEAKELRDVLPKDIVVIDWHYAPVQPEKFTGLGILSKAGFRSLSATWDTLLNISNFAKATAQAVKEPEGEGKTLGMIHTTWAGYSFDETSLAESYQQYAQYVYAAEMMWNGGKFGAKPYDWAKAFSATFGQAALSDHARTGFALPLVSKPEETGASPFAIKDCGPYAGRIFVGEFAKKGETNGVVLAGMFNKVGKDGGRGITKLHVPVNKKAKDLIITGATLSPMKPKEKVAEILVVYEDETYTWIPIIVGSQIGDIFDETSRPTMTITKLPKVKDCQNTYLHSSAWANPHPDKLIKRLEITSEGTRSGVFLRGITGLN